jgi:RHS repeat-associated protein
MDALSNTTTFTYDSMNRLKKITYPDNSTTQFAYDTRGRHTSVTDANNKATTYAYDDANRLTQITNPANNITAYAYDTESNLTGITDALTRTTSFTYDALGRVTKTTFPSYFFETYGYDNVGNLTSKTDRNGKTVTYTYDQLNRQKAKYYPDSTSVTYTYDNDSHLTQVSDPTGTYQFTYDNMGRLKQTTTSYVFLTGKTFTDAYAYDAASNRTSLTDPENGATSYSYDSLNRLTTLAPPSAFGSGSFGLSYDALSRRAQLTRPNSVSTSYTYDLLSRLLSATHATRRTTLDGASYTVDAVGNRTSRTPLPSGTATNYSYDGIYELLIATQGSTTKESYSYDVVGNRLSSLGVSPYSYNTSNELTAKPGVAYTYDNNGNALTKVDSTGTTTYAWDFENRLSSVTLPGSGGTITFKYDPLGRRIYKSSSSGTSIFAYDADNLIEEVSATAVVVARYTQGLGIDEPLAELRAGTVSYYEQDGLSSVTSLSNSAGAIVNTYTYDSYGKLVSSSGTLTNPFQYTAREFDAETGLYYYRARYYDPSVGRFISEDPIAFNGGFNFYRYVSNSPANFVDPFGEQIGFVGDTLATQTALLYLESSPAANTIIQDLEKSPILYIIDASNGHLIDVTDPYRKRTVFWKPDQALCVKNGVQSPAIQLLHELTHLWQAQNNKSFNEENAVQITNPAAQQLGEPTRINYADAQGNPIWILPIPNR